MQTILTMRRVLTLARLVPQTQRLSLTGSWQSRDLSSSATLQGSLTMPERLQHIPEAEVGREKQLVLLIFDQISSQDPGFFEMVEYFFHKACILSEDRLIDLDMKNVRATREEKMKKAHGILKIIEPCAHVLEVNFPLLRDDGSYEMINGYRAQHSHHRYTGGVTQ